jgi:hypothetical protein
MSDSNRQERVLVVLLRLSGCILLLAFPAMLLPLPWMAATHRWLGLGAYPESTIVEYLSRSISALYGIHGGLVLVVSTNVRRYARIVAYLAATNVLFGTFMLLIDLDSGMPWFWTISEGPPLIAFGALLLFLLRSVPAER